MANYRKINGAIWGDPYFHSLDPWAKLTFMYLAFFCPDDGEGNLLHEGMTDDLNLAPSEILPYVQDRDFLEHANSWRRR